MEPKVVLEGDLTSLEEEEEAGPEPTRQLKKGAEAWPGRHWTAGGGGAAGVSD